MANKFSKSIIERLEQEAQQQKKTSNKKEHEPKVEIAPEPVSSEVMITSPPPNKKKAVKAKPVAVPDLSEYIRSDLRRQAKNKTFYLDMDLLDAIKQAAQVQGVAESRLVNDILRKVLGI